MTVSIEGGSSVAALAAALAALPADATVIMEGCDCEGLWGGEIEPVARGRDGCEASENMKPNAVLLKR